MKKILNISIVAALAVSPMLAFADNYQGGSETVLTGEGSTAPYALSADASNDGTNVVTASYVKGAYNDLTRKINTVAAAAGTDATTKITNAAGNGLAGNNGKLSVDLTDKGGLELTGTGADGTKTLGAKVDGTTIVKDSSTGALKVGAITESQVTDLQTHLNNKQGILTNNDATENANTSINTTVLTTVGATGTNNSLVTEKAVRDAITAATTTANMVTTTGTQTLTNKTIDVDSNSVSNIEVDNFKSSAIATTIDTGAEGHETSNDKLATETAVRTAVDAVASQTMTLTNKTIDADDNTIQDLVTTNFKSGTVVTTVGATGSDATLPTEKAVRDAITAATTTAGMVTTTTINNNSLPINASALKVGGKDVATQSAVVNTIGTSTVTIPVLATWGGSTTTNGSTLTISAASYAEPAAQQGGGNG